MDGAGTLVLTGANSFTGGAQIDDGGALQVGDGTTDGGLAGVGWAKVVPRATPGARRARRGIVRRRRGEGVVVRSAA
jgi:autotransporter-associated beta strand protein